jgi:hypothetical protein
MHRRPWGWSLLSHKNPTMRVNNQNWKDIMIADEVK